MSLETLNAIAQLIAALGVIASLFYLSAQIRQNTISQRAVVVDSLAHALVELLGPQALSADTAQTFARTVEQWEGATEEDRARAVTMLFPMFKIFENAWFQNRHGTLDPQQWEGWDAFIRMYHHRPGAKTWWTLRRGAFAPGFREYLENSQAPKDLPPISELIHGKS